MHLNIRPARLNRETISLHFGKLPSSLWHAAPKLPKRRGVSFAASSPPVKRRIPIARDRLDKIRKILGV
jgi:hypothetical protein